MLCVCLLTTLAAHGVGLPVWFDTFQEPRESRRAWQTFRAADRMAFEGDGGEAVGGILTARARFGERIREAILIWRFPDVRMERFRVRFRVSGAGEDAAVYLRMATNDTTGAAAFFKPYTTGDARDAIPIHTDEGVKSQPASPLPTDEWLVYEVALPDDVFHYQEKQKPRQDVQDFSLMNKDRGQLNLRSGSRPAIEAVFLVFAIPEGSPLAGRDVEIQFDTVEIY